MQKQKAPRSGEPFALCAYLFIYILHRQGEYEAGSASVFGIENDVAIQAASYRAGYGKAATSTIEEAVELREWLEYLLGIISRNACASILHNELYFRTIGGGKQSY